MSPFSRTNVAIPGPCPPNPQATTQLSAPIAPRNFRIACIAMSQPRFFVIGATGYIGVPLVRLLSSFGYDVRGLARSGDKATLLGLDGILPVMGTLDNPESWIGAASEAEFLIDVSQNNSDREGHAAKVERAANLWAETRKRQGKPKGYFLYTSGTGVHGDLYERLKRPLSEADTPTPPKFVAFRPALEQRIINSSEWVGYVIRPGFVYGRKVGFLTCFRSPFIPLIFSHFFAGVLFWYAYCFIVAWFQ